MDFALFVLLNAVMLLRPDDLFPEQFAGYRLYLLTIVPTLLAAAPRLTAALNPRELANRPITACVIGFWAASVASNAVRGQVGLAFGYGGEFGKVVLYYLLLTAVVDTPGRLRAFLGWLVVIVAVLAGLALLQMTGAINIEALKPVEGRLEIDSATGELIQFDQLRAHGMFADPNDLCLILVVGMAAAAYLAATAGGWAGSAVWAAPGVVFLYALTETKSRGGLMALGAAVGAVGLSRFGPVKAAVTLAVLGVGVMAAGGRQTNLGAEGAGTATQRVLYWNEGFQLLFSFGDGPQTPVTGIGMNEFYERILHVAHNSYVHSFVETGVVGGTVFAGAIFLAGWGVWRVRPGREFHPRSELAGVRPYLLAAVVGYAVGIFALSRAYTLPAYLVLGVASAYLAMVLPAGAPWFRVDGRLARRVAVVGLGVLVFHRVFTFAYLRTMGGFPTRRSWSSATPSGTRPGWPSRWPPGSWSPRC